MTIFFNYGFFLASFTVDRAHWKWTARSAIEIIKYKKMKDLLLWVQMTFFLIQPSKSLFAGIIIAVVVIAAYTP